MCADDVDWVLPQALNNGVNVQAREKTIPCMRSCGFA